ncbi:hypothetical protein FIBSPDRAFT_906231, partial [Athelia psychrophila]
MGKPRTGKTRPRKIKSGTLPTLSSSTHSTTLQKKTRIRVGEEVAEGLKKRREALATEISAVRAQANAIAVGNGAAPDTDIPMLFYDDGNPEWVNMGEEDDLDDEGEISHGGGEREDRAQAIFESITMPSARLSALHASWNAQMPRLVRAYLAWKYGPSDGDSDGDDSDSQHMDDAVDGIFHVTAIGIT